MGELGSILGGARLLGALPRLSFASRGDGRLVVDIPGWRAPEISGAPLRSYLKRLGYDARGWGFGTNTGDPRRDVQRLSKRVLELVEARGAGLAGRLEPRRRDRPGGRPPAPRCRSPGRHLRHTRDRRCHAHHDRARLPTRADVDAERVARRLHAAYPIEVPLTVVFSKRDGVVSWQACIDHATPGVEHVEVSSTHIGMGIDPDVWAIVADRLAR